MDEELINGQVQIERKLFSFSLRENPRGRFLKITENIGKRREAATGGHSAEGCCDTQAKTRSHDTVVPNANASGFSGMATAETSSNSCSR